MQDTYGNPFAVFKDETKMETEDLDNREFVKTQFLEFCGVTEGMQEADAAQLPGAMQKIVTMHTNGKCRSKRRSEVANAYTGIPATKAAQYTRKRPLAPTERPREPPSKSERPADTECSDDRRWERPASGSNRWDDWVPYRYERWTWGRRYAPEPWQGWRDWSDWSGWTQWNGWRDADWWPVARAAAATAAASSMTGADASPSDGESATAGVPIDGDPSWSWVFCALLAVFIMMGFAARCCFQRNKQAKLSVQTVGTQTEDYDIELGEIFWANSGRHDLRYHTDPNCKWLKSARSPVVGHRGCYYCTVGCTVRGRGR